MNKSTQPLSGAVVVAASIALLGSLLIYNPWNSPRAADRQADGKTAVATFAGGCFWCMEHPYDSLEGVVSTTVGYTGGKTENPTYKQVSSGLTGHLESIQIEYDPEKVDYEKLLDVFWHNIDPTQRGGQFCDDGNQYRSAIFYHDDQQQKLAESTKKAVGKELRKKIVTDVLPAEKFWPAEDYHQDYYLKNPLRYRFYRYNCGRDQRLQAVWGDKAGH